MSRVVNYVGTLEKINKLENETLEEQCKRLLNNVELEEFYDTYEEMFEDTVDDEYVICNGEIYKVEKEELDSNSSKFSISVKNKKINFDVLYYNGGCCFKEAIEKAFENMKEGAE
jgi:hypothetical protein